MFILPDGTKVSVSDQFQIADQKYPAEWLNSASDQEIAAAGITATTIPDPIQPTQPVIISPIDFRKLFTDAERLAVTQASLASASLRVFMDDETAATSVLLSDPEVIAGVNSLVSTGLLTQDRADKILANIAPI